MTSTYAVPHEVVDEGSSRCPEFLAPEYPEGHIRCIRHREHAPPHEYKVTADEMFALRDAILRKRGQL